MRTHLGFLSTVLGGIAMTFGASAVAESEPALDYHYMCFDEPVSITLDAASIAVFADPAGPSLAPLEQRLAAHDIAADELIWRSRPGWVHAPVSEDARTAAGVEALATDLAASGDFDFVSPVFIDERGLPLVITRDLLIGFQDGAEAEAIIAALDGARILDVDFGGLDNVYRVRSGSLNGFEVLQQANTLAARADVRFAESDFLVKGQTLAIPNDPLFGQLWGLNQANDQDMDAPEAWDTEMGDPSIVVAILDIGMQVNHPDLNSIVGEDFTGDGTFGGGPTTICDNHGTAVAGCVAGIANNGIGIAGVAPGVSVVSGKIGTSDPFFGFCFGTFDSQPTMLVNALNWTATNGYRVTNSSFSYSTSSAVNSAYQNARDNGVIHFAATGNGGNSSISYPSSLPSINAVGAMNASGNLASFSQYGTGIAFCAPGENITSCDRTGGDGYESGDYVSGIDGTSFASPYAAGVAALILSVDSSLTPDEVEQIMNDTAVDLGASGYDTTYGWGFLNANNAVLAVAPDPAPTPDFDDNGQVDADDLFFLLGNWGACEAPCPPACDADLNEDCSVNSDDLFELLGAWGPYPG